MFNEKIGKYGAWDADTCTTVLSEQSTTVCECGSFGTYALVAEKVEDPYVGEEYDWLRYGAQNRVFGWSVSRESVFFWWVGEYGWLRYGIN